MISLRDNIEHRFPRSLSDWTDHSASLNLQSCEESAARKMQWRRSNSTLDVYVRKSANSLVNGGVWHLTYDSGSAPPLSWDHHHPFLWWDQICSENTFRRYHCLRDFFRKCEPSLIKIGPSLRFDILWNSAWSRESWSTKQMINFVDRYRWQQNCARCIRKDQSLSSQSVAYDTPVYKFSWIFPAVSF